MANGGVGDGSLRFRRGGARDTVKDVVGTNAKAFGKAIDPKFPRMCIFCRKLGFAGPSANRTSQNFNPTFTGHPWYAPRSANVPIRSAGTTKLTSAQAAG